MIVHKTFFAIHWIALSTLQTAGARCGGLLSGFCSFCKWFVVCNPVSDRLVWKCCTSQIHCDILPLPSRHHHKVRWWAGDSTFLWGACRVLPYSKNRHLSLKEVRHMIIQVTYISRLILDNEGFIWNLSNACAFVLRRSLLPFTQTPARGALDFLPITQGQMIEYDRHYSRDIFCRLDHHH